MIGVVAAPHIVSKLLRVHLLVVIRRPANEARLGLDMIVEYMLAQSIIGWRRDVAFLIGKQPVTVGRVVIGVIEAS